MIYVHPISTLHRELNLDVCDLLHDEVVDCSLQELGTGVNGDY